MSRRGAGDVRNRGFAELPVRGAEDFQPGQRGVIGHIRRPIPQHALMLVTGICPSPWAVSWLK